MPKRCSQTKLMDSSDIFNKQAVNCELGQAEVLFPIWQSAALKGGDYDEP